MAGLARGSEICPLTVDGAWEGLVPALPDRTSLGKDHA